MVFAWALLVAAIGIEVAATAPCPAPPASTTPAGRPPPCAGRSSIWLLTVVVERMPVSVAYAVWAGLGTAGIAVVGYLFLGESLDWVKAGAIGLIITGVVMLNATGSH